MDKDFYTWVVIVGIGIFTVMLGYVLITRGHSI